MNIEKYFSDQGILSQYVKAIDVSREGVNLYRIVFRTDDDQYLPVGPFSGETMTALIQYWIDNQ